MFWSGKQRKVSMAGFQLVRERKERDELWELGSIRSLGFYRPINNVYLPAVLLSLKSFPLNSILFHSPNMICSVSQAKDTRCCPIFSHYVWFKAQLIIMFNKCVWLSKLKCNINGNHSFKIPKHSTVFKFSDSIKNTLCILMKYESFAC